MSQLFPFDVVYFNNTTLAAVHSRAVNQVLQFPKTARIACGRFFSEIENRNAFLNSILKNLFQIVILGLGHIYGINPFYISRKVTYHRIIRASELLRKNLPVSQVSEMAGFQNYCHFITTFKKIAGISPKQFAKGRTINTGIWNTDKV